MAHDVFISYSTKDKSVADAACHALEARGVRCWIAPRDIPYGSEWSEQIVEAIDKAGALVLVFSSNANGSSQVKRELSNAADRGIPILPLRIEDVLPSKGFRYYLGGVHWLDALSPPLEAHLGRLADRVSAVLAADQAGASSSESRMQEDERPPNPRPGQTEQRPPRTHPSDSPTTRQEQGEDAQRMAAAPPTGTVTFLFTDVEGSTRLWERDPSAMRPALARHDEILQSAIEGNGGYVFKTVGDAFCAAFAAPIDASGAALASQRALSSEPWTE